LIISTAIAGRTSLQLERKQSIMNVDWSKVDLQQPNCIETLKVYNLSRKELINVIFRDKKDTSTSGILKLIPRNIVTVPTEPDKAPKKRQKSSIRTPNLCGVHIIIIATPSDDNNPAMYEIKRLKNDIMHSHDLEMSDRYKVK
jgi:hypothetical protein